MKKIIATIIRFFMPKAVRKHEREEKARQIHNVLTMQNLLDSEHIIRDAVNKRFNTAYTTKEALKWGRIYSMSDYISSSALEEADFR